MTPLQCRLCRAGLNLSARDLAELAGVNVNTVVRFEAGNLPVRDQTVLALQAALESRGCTLLAADEHGPGVRIKLPV